MNKAATAAVRNFILIQVSFLGGMKMEIVFVLLLCFAFATFSHASLFGSISHQTNSAVQCATLGNTSSCTSQSLLAFFFHSLPSRVGAYECTSFRFKLVFVNLWFGRF